MSKKIILDSGHGYNTPGKRTPNDVREWTMNDAVCRYAAAALAEYDVEVLRCDDITGKTDIAVQKRTETINSINPDLFVSIHHNGNTGQWGDWSYVCAFYNVNKPKRDADLATLFSAEISKQTGIRNNGGLPDTKSAVGSLHMVRETKSSIPSVLLEGGFMDSRKDEPIITSAAGQKAYGQAVANVCVSYLGLQKKTSQSSTSKLTPITGKSGATAEQMTAYIKKVNPNVPQSVVDMIPLYLSEGEAEGIRGDGAFAQSCIETGNFAFGNGTAVTIEQNNFCGMAVLSKGERGNSYATPQLGIRAQIQHLKAYASTEPLKNALVTPKAGESRFKYVERGIAPYYEWLGAKENPKGKGWATGEGYGSKILTILNSIVNTAAPTAIAAKDKVKVLNAVTYNGGTFRVYYSLYDVFSVSGDRAVIGIGTTVTAAVNVKNLQKA